MLLTYHYKRYILQISFLFKKVPLGTSFLGCSPSNCTYSTLQTNYNQSTRYLRNGYEILCFPVIFNITFLLFLIFWGTDTDLVDMNTKQFDILTSYHVRYIATGKEIRDLNFN